jgi:hypothetical protein
MPPVLSCFEPRSRVFPVWIFDRHDPIIRKSCALETPRLAFETTLEITAVLEKSGANAVKRTVGWLFVYLSPR